MTPSCTFTTTILPCSAMDAGEPNFGCSMDAEQSHLDEIKSVAMAFGFTPEEIDHLAAEGFSADELEEVLYGYGGEL